jgi:hypothetical protein
MEKVSSNRVTLYPDGKYRWVYEMNLLKNPSVLFDLWWVFGITILIIAVLFIVFAIFDGDFDWDSISGMFLTLGIVTAIIFVLSLLGYFVYAAISGWKYVVLFIMDENEVVHQQMPREVKKGQLIGDLTMLVGALAGRPGIVGTGLLAKSRSSMTSTLANVKRLVPCRWMNLIKVNQTFSKNRVYVTDEDFDFVYDFLCTHCTKAKKD